LHDAIAHEDDDRELVIASCGNAALAAAVVARAVGRPLRVFIPDDAPPSVVVRLAQLGAVTVECARVPGERGDPCYLRFRDAVAAGAMPFSCQGTDAPDSIDGGRTIALELAEHRMQAEQMAVFEDRDRIAKDLHDLVIQRLYATGMSLQGVTSLIKVPEVADRVSRSVDALDDTIMEIRSAIFALQTRSETKPAAARARILFVAQEMASALGFPPSLQLDGALDTVLPDQITEHLLTALREALSNAARHSGASQVDVTVTANGELVLEVKDNGVGIVPGGRRSGLRNLEQRAAALGGSMVTRPAEGGGTELIWRVPLAQD